MDDDHLGLAGPHVSFGKTPLPSPSPYGFLGLDTGKTIAAAESGQEDTDGQVLLLPVMDEFGVVSPRRDRYPALDVGSAVIVKGKGRAF